MSKLEELINKLCPNGVEFKTLGELGKFYGGLTGKSKEDFNKGNAKFITYKNVYENLSLKIDVEDRVNIGENEKQRTLEYGDIIFTGSSETSDECGISSVLTQKTEEKLYLNSFCFFLRLNDKNLLNPDFTKHLFRSSNLRYQIGKTASGVTRFNVSKKAMEKVCIPVPPLEVQCEIVRILDNFTLLSAELSAELSARQKQYEYYLNDLLNIKKLNPEKIMYVKDLFEIKNGLNKEKSAFGKGTPIVNFTDVYKNRYLIKEMLKGKVTLNDFEIERYKVLKGDVFFTRTSETRDDIGMSSAVIEDIEDCTFSGFVLRARPITNLLSPKFCAYYFSTNQVRDNIVRYASFTTRATTSGPKLAKIPVPIISLKEQERIVNILDKFEKLCNDLSEGLPAEIEARKKQYEYYRDKLLTFKELK
ncbi:restriction endonuclease subunit S [Campylobacter lanienae]|uniref:restriction endonuclease subunit S n=1 Tax=Campylobacter lanienae TaxID=75658 RepID=UPI000BB41333|nr:restriction endonuclease subunit S [Campylobacter lanienae]